MKTGLPLLHPARIRRTAVALGIVLGAYVLVAYAILPLIWTEVERGHHPALAGLPTVTSNADGIPADPLNVGSRRPRRGGRPGDARRRLVPGRRHHAEDEHRRSPAAWPVRSAGNRAAPVSNLCLYDGRRQDLAFEQGCRDERR